MTVPAVTLSRMAGNIYVTMTPHVYLFDTRGLSTSFGIAIWKRRSLSLLRFAIIFDTPKMS